MRVLKPLPILVIAGLLTGTALSADPPGGKKGGPRGHEKREEEHRALERRHEEPREHERREEDRHGRGKHGKGVPPGLAKKGGLPPGLARHWGRFHHQRRPERPYVAFDPHHPDRAWFLVDGRWELRTGLTGLRVEIQDCLRRPPVPPPVPLPRLDVSLHVVLFD